MRVCDCPHSFCCEKKKSDEAAREAVVRSAARFRMSEQMLQISDDDQKPIAPLQSCFGHSRQAHEALKRMVVTS